MRADDGLYKKSKMMNIQRLLTSVRRYQGLVLILGLFCLWMLASGSVKAFDQEEGMASNANEMAGVVRKPDLLLLKSYDESMEVNGWLMSEKLDGVRAYWDGKNLWSRQGNLFAAPEWFTENFPPFELDGELWLGRGQFEQTVSIVNKHRPHSGWQAITYQIFEVPNQAGGLLERLAILQSYLQHFPAPYVRIIEQVPVKSVEQLQLHLKDLVGLGAEGLVVRNPSAPYLSGRSDQALKVKIKQDAECVVRGYTEGKGKYIGQVGALLCEIAPGQFKHLSKPADRVLKIGSGLSDQQRANPPAIGTLVTFQYMGLTRKGLPRFPVFLRVRSDLNSNELSH